MSAALETKVGGGWIVEAVEQSAIEVAMFLLK